MAAAIILSAVGFAIWPGFSFLQSNRTPIGGVLLLHDRLPFEAEGDELLGLAAEVDVDFWASGEPGVSIAELTIQLESPRPDDHWYVVSSGDFAVSADRYENLYCKYGSGMLVDGRIECASQAGNPAHEFRFDQELGDAINTVESAKSIIDLEGYDKEQVTVVSGSMPTAREDGRAVVDVWLPISSPRTYNVGGDEFIAVPPIAWTDVEWGVGPLLAEPCEFEASEVFARFVLTKSCTPVTSISISRTFVDAGVDIGSRAVEYASPDTVSDDALEWDMDGGFPGARALIRDPFEQADESRRAFLAALVLSAGVSFALLSFERILFHRKHSNNR
jgi:hypothetical protein